MTAGVPVPRGAGVLVVGHGTADPVGADETRLLAGLVADLLPGQPVELGFLEVIGPTIPDAFGRLAGRGVREVIVAPLLLFTAGHARRDVPDAVASAAAAHGIPVCQSEPLGGHPAVVSLSRRRRHEAVRKRPPVSSEATALLVIGRGASDPSAAGQFESFVETTLATGPERPAHVLHGFAAAARPTLDEAVNAAATLPDVRRIIVQPHLLFSGHVLDQVARAVAVGRRMRPDLDWVEVGRLGADPLVAAAVVDRVVEAVVGFGDREACPGLARPRIGEPG